MAQQLLCDTSELEKQKTSLENEMEIVDEAAKKLVERNARVTMDQNEFQQERPGDDGPERIPTRIR